MEADTEAGLIEQNLELARQIIHAALDDPDVFPDDLLVIPMNLLAGSDGLLTPARFEVLLKVREHGSFDRLQDLADSLGRGKHRVSKDIDALTALGLIRKERRGRTLRLTADNRPILLS